MLKLLERIPMLDTSIVYCTLTGDEPWREAFARRDGWGQYVVVLPVCVVYIIKEYYGKKEF